jgi:prophage antirepressor-like protein
MNDSTNVIPFNFGEQQVRTLLIDDQPWFVATDVSAALQYRDSFNMCRNLDDDEKGTQIVSTLGGAQEMLAINEPGLYSAILRSRKAEAKRFKKWVTSEVLPAIRKHGRYEDNQGKMPTLMDELIGMSELSVIKGLIRDKGKAVSSDRQKSFALVMHNRLHTRFNVPRTELIPADQFEAACNFIAAYNVLEGEFMAARPEKGIILDQYETHDLYLLMSHFFNMQKRQRSVLAAAQALDSKLLLSFFDHLNDGAIAFSYLDKRRDEIYAAYTGLGMKGGYAQGAAA